MNHEKIHDALNLIDDSMIEEVDRLRASGRKSRKLRISLISAAACLCILLLGVAITASSGLLRPDNVVSDSAYPEITENRNNSDKTDGEYYTFGNSGSPDYAAPQPDETPSVLVKISSWQDDGFTGTVAGIVDTTKYSVGTQVKVIMGEHICIVTPANNGYHYTQRTPEPADFPAGSVVRVQFGSSAIKAQDNDNSSAQIILYAEAIELISAN